VSKIKQHYDDLTEEEVKDVEEFYTTKSDHKTRTLKELLNELNSIDQNVES
jgi:uncharacterized protein (DUF433 family)